MVSICDVCGCNTHTTGWHGRDLCWSCIVKLDHVSNYRVRGLVGDREVSCDYCTRTEDEAVAAFRDDMAGAYVVGVDKL